MRFGIEVIFFLFSGFAFASEPTVNQLLEDPNLRASYKDECRFALNNMKSLNDLSPACKNYGIAKDRMFAGEGNVIFNGQVVTIQEANKLKDAAHNAKLAQLRISSKAKNKPFKQTKRHITKVINEHLLDSCGKPARFVLLSEKNVNVKSLFELGVGQGKEAFWKSLSSLSCADFGYPEKGIEPVKQLASVVQKRVKAVCGRSISQRYLKPQEIYLEMEALSLSKGKEAVDGRLSELSCDDFDMSKANSF